jgi:NCS1 family nucleobase:cation symporter-1
MTSTDAQAAHISEVREGDYGTKVAAVEPGGAEFIPLNERHGRPLNLFWTWTSPNFEFATVFVGVLPLFFGESFTQAALAIISAPGSARSRWRRSPRAAPSTACRR